METCLDCKDCGPPTMPGFIFACGVVNYIDTATCFMFTPKSTGDKMNKQKMIKKLKDPNQAQPYFVLPENEKDILQEIGKGWLFRLACNGQWQQAQTDTLWLLQDVYIIKPSYWVQPEYVDIEIVVCNGGLWLKDAAPGWTGDCSIAKASTHEDFVDFRDVASRRFRNVADIPVTTRMPGLVPTWLRVGRDVVARFVKETK